MCVECGWERLFKALFFAVVSTESVQQRLNTVALNCKHPETISAAPCSHLNASTACGQARCTAAAPQPVQITRRPTNAR